MPAVEAIVDALVKAKEKEAAQESSRVSGSPKIWRRSWLALPGIGVTLLPTACPACWPAYAALVSNLGLGFLLSERHLFALTAALVGLAVGVLGIPTSKLRGYLPFSIGLFGVLILLGKFVIASGAMLFTGGTLLAGASAWRVLTIRRLAGGSCPACTGCGEAAKEKTKGR